MFINVSGKLQVLRNKFGVYRRIGNNGVISDYVFEGVKLLPKTVFKKIKKLDLIGVKRLLIQRGHALGDVVMTIPLVNYFKSLGIEVTLNTNTRYVIEGVDFITGGSQVCYNEYDLILDLDWILERDHYEKRLYEKSRVDIYKDYLNLKDIGNNWSIDFEEKNIDIDDAIIGIQLNGSQKHKSIDLNPVFRELDSKNIKFYVIDRVYNSLSYKNAVERPTDILGLLNVFKKLKGVLCFDSGILWLSHVTNTPAFIVVGPTSGKKVSLRHPNDKTVYYDTKKDYNCNMTRGCGESAKKCNGEFSCLKNVDYIKVLYSFNNWLEGL